MLPHLHLFGFEVRTYIVCLALAALVCHTIGPRWTQSLTRRTTRLILLWLGLAAFAGGRAHFAVNLWPIASFSRNPIELLRFWEGLHAGGALVALLVATPIVCRAYGVSVARFADAVAPSGLLAIAVARLGCLATGCCFGTPTELPWGISFVPGTPAYTFQVRERVISAGAELSAGTHPLQLYFVLAGILGAAVSWRVRRDRGYSGRGALRGITTYLVVAALAEPFRAGSYPRPYFWGPALQFQWIAAAMAVAALIVAAIAELATRRTLPAVSERSVAAS